MFLTVFLFVLTAESFQLLTDMLDLAIFFQHFELLFQVLDLSVQTIQFTDKMCSVNKRRHRSTMNLIRLDSVCCDDVLGDTGNFHIATVDSITNKLVLLCFRSNLSDFDSRNIYHTALILCDTPFDLLGFIVPAKSFASSKLGSRIALFLLRKHKFQVDLMLRIVFNKHAEIGTLGKEVLKIFADFDYLIYREFQLCLPLRQGRLFSTLHQNCCTE